MRCAAQAPHPLELQAWTWNVVHSAAPTPNVAVLVPVPETSPVRHTLRLDGSPESMKRHRYRVGPGSPWNVAGSTLPLQESESMDAAGLRLTCVVSTHAPHPPVLQAWTRALYQSHAPMFSVAVPDAPASALTAPD